MGDNIIYYDTGGYMVLSILGLFLLLTREGRIFLSLVLKGLIGLINIILSGGWVFLWIALIVRITQIV